MKKLLSLLKKHPHIAVIAAAADRNMSFRQIFIYETSFAFV